VGEVGESIPVYPEKEGELHEVYTETGGPLEVSETDDADAAEAAPSGAEPEIPEEAPVEVEEEVKIKVTVDTTEAVEAIEELENTTESTIEQLKAQIADMEAKIAAAKKEAENET